MGLEFSFDAKNYRKNLADSLREKRSENPESAKELLQKERETLQYKVSADIKKVLAKIEAKKHGKEEPALEHTEPKEIGIERLKMTGSDGVERELEVHTLDISDQLPNGLRLAHDVFRLAVLESDLSHAKIESGGFKIPTFLNKEDSNHVSRLFESALKYQNVGNLLFLYYVFPKYYQEYLNGDEQQRGEIFTHALEESRQLNAEIMTEYEEFLDGLTDGSFSNNKMCVHVVGADDSEAYINAQKYQENVQFLDYRKDEHNDTASRMYKDTEGTIRRQSRYPRSNITSGGEMIAEQPLDIHSPSSESLWFNAGGSPYDSRFKLIMLCNSANSRFRNEISGVFAYDNLNLFRSLHKLKNITPPAEFDSRSSRVSSYINSATLEEKIEAAQLLMSAKGLGAAGYSFKRDEPWLYLADWIVDAYHGRAYRIAEKSS